MIILILIQIFLNTHINYQIEREQFYINILNLRYNILKIAYGQIVIKSTGKFLKKGAPIGVIVLDENGGIINEYESINTCGAYLCVSHQTVRRRLRDGKSIKFNSRLLYIKPK